MPSDFHYNENNEMIYFFECFDFRKITKDKASRLKVNFKNMKKIEYKEAIMKMCVYESF